MNRLNARAKSFETLSAARAHALETSKKFPVEYVVISDCFGWIVNRIKRLGVFAPSDYSNWSGKTGTYWLNGKEKAFSASQKLQDQINSPDMM